MQSDPVSPLTATESRGATANRLMFPGLESFYAWARPAAFTLLRVGFGLILFTHGLPKAQGAGHAGAANAFFRSVDRLQNQLHLPFPTALATSVTLLETAGALMLAAGLFTRIVAPMIAIEMAVICFALWPVWVWNAGGLEYPLLMGLLALYIAVNGGGKYSLDRLIGREI